MATWDDVERLALALPETTQRPAWGNRAWRVKDKMFVWERPLRKTDLAELGDAAPDGDILGAAVEHEGAKRALIEDDPETFFTTSHFDGHASILAVLDRLDAELLNEVVVEAWLCRAPERLAKDYLAG
jgi:hypothetical protein